MKKTTLLLLSLFATGMSAQTYTSGVKNLTSGYTAKIDVNSTTVTLTLVGPASGWLGIGFNTTNMSAGKDVVIFDGVNLSDRSMAGLGSEPPLDAQQDWTVTSNDVVGNVRTVIGTRARVTGDTNDYTFSASAQTINLVWARRLADFDIEYHGGGSCGSVSTAFTLGTEDFDIASFKMYPNPSKTFTTIELPANVESGVVKIYDALGRVVRKQEITRSQNNVATEGLSAGSYMVVLRTEYGNATKTLLVE